MNPEESFGGSDFCYWNEAYDAGLRGDALNTEWAMSLTESREALVRFNWPLQAISSYRP